MNAPRFYKQKDAEKYFGHSWRYINAHYQVIDTMDVEGKRVYYVIIEE